MESEAHRGKSGISYLKIKGLNFKGYASPLKRWGYFIMTAAEYIQELSCGCYLRYEAFISWLHDIRIPAEVREALMPRVLQTGGLSPADWSTLLNSAEFAVGSPKDYLAQLNSCGQLCMEDLILGISYTSSAEGIFSIQFSNPFV